MIGPKADNKPWRVGISKPGDYNTPIAYIEIDQDSITTSGSEERYVEIDGKQYNHLISPLSGQPVTGLKSVSIRAPQTIVAGSLTTIAMLKQESESLQWLSELGLPFIAVDRAGNTHGTIV